MASHQHNGIENLLEERGKDGEMVDSSSSFRLDPRKAREKLSRHQLQEPGLWLVKIVQAAVASGASEMKVTFGRRRVTAAFRPQSPLEATEILQQVVAETTTENRILAHLVTGLRAVSCTVNQSVDWRAGNHSVTLGADGTRVAPVKFSEDFTVTAERPKRGIPWKQLLVVPLGQVVKQTLDDWWALGSRCWPSPVPIKADGRILRHGLDAVPEARLQRDLPGRSGNIYRCLGFAALSSPVDRPELNIGSPEDVQITRGPSFHGTFLRFAPSSRPAHGGVGFHPAGTVDPTVDFVLDGAVVESRPIQPIVDLLRDKSFFQRPLILPKFVFAIRPDELDLGGFGVRGIDHMELVRMCLGESRELLSMIEERFDLYRGRAVDEKKLLRKGLESLKELLDLCDRQPPVFSNPSCPGNFPEP